MPRKALTEVGVSKMEFQPGKQVVYFDIHQPGLLLVVGTKTKTWRALYYVKRRKLKTKKIGWVPKTKRIGRYPTLRVKEARERARLFLQDPKAAMQGTVAGTFGEVAEQFMQRHANKLLTHKEVKRCIDKYLLPDWRDLSFEEIRRTDVIARLRQIETNSGPRQADVVLSIISKMMGWYALELSDTYRPPLVKGMARQKQLEHRRDRFLDNDEIRLLWVACDQLGIAGRLVKVLLLCAQRKGKVLTMRWEDIDRDGVWTIPHSRGEKQTPKRIKLPAMAMAIITKQPRIAGNPWVWGSASPFRSDKAKVALDQLLPKDMPGWVLHDLRRTARALMTRAKVPVDVAELALGHSIKGIQATYDNPSEYDPEIDIALEAVAAQVNLILNPPPPNVVKMEKRPRR